MTPTLWVLIPLLPLLGVVINLFFGHRLSEKTVGWLATVLVGLAAALALLGIAGLPGVAGEERTLVIPLYQWIGAGDFAVDASFLIDPLSALMIIVVTGVGFLIHMYSIGYMGHDRDIRRFFVYLNLFIFSMLILVMGANFLVLFVGWELVGLCSYLLIGFWYEEGGVAGHANEEAGRKAFIVNRIGDIAVLLAIFLIFINFGSLAFAEVFPRVATVNAGALLAIGLLLFVGCTGKSAQIPLYVWLPDAMAGPTPVSALIHAATMVTAGVYLVARAHPIFEASAAGDVVTWIGVLTAFFAATIAVTQTDIKRVLAYSTVSQLGFMFIGVGAGAYVAGMFHFFTHAFFKALLFLGAGSVMHAMERSLEHVHGHQATDSEPGEAEEPAHFDVQDMRLMGGLWGRTRSTGWTFLIGALALAGFPLTSGFFSKDELLTLAQHNGYTLVYILGLITAFMTAFYAFRQFFLVFAGEARTEAAAHAEESPPVMTIPLWVLALFAALAGLAFGLPLENGLIHSWLEPVFADVHHAEAAAGIPTAISLLLSSVIALAGIGLAWLMYVQRSLAPERVAEVLAPLYRGSLHKWYIDEAYDRLVVRPFNRLAAFSADFIDRLVIDGAVNGVAVLFGGISRILSRAQTGYARNYALSMLLGAVAVVAYFLLR
ncbi:MAG TPA: NADH-quinone oxidoreductase subunit L [Chloroflexi bacterium]|nr:NADH-quinone oxidoreductase subunit L [Chloroflexota bacterium]